MLGLKFQPLDDGEVLLFMAFCSCQKLLFPMNYSCTKTSSTTPKSNEIIMETSRKLWRKGKKSDREGCVAKKEKNQMGRGACYKVLFPYSVR